MTPSSIRPIFHRNAAPMRRTSLLAASALCGVATMLAQPALAQLPGVPGAGSITVSIGGSQPLITAPNANTLEIDLNAPRTAINWASLNVGAADTMNFHFDASSDIVLNKTTSQITIASGGTVTGKVGASDGGNIWFYSPQGIVVSPGAVMTGGGFLFSRGPAITDFTFVNAGDPLGFLRAATDSLIKIDDDSVLVATTASIDPILGEVVLSRASGNINAALVIGSGDVIVEATTGNVTVSELRAGISATVSAGGSGATVSTIRANTSLSVSSAGNTSVGSATTLGGDITIQGGTVVALTTANTADDVFLTAPQIFVSTIDAGNDVFITATTGGATVTNRVFAGDDVEVTATTGDITAGGATLRSTGLGNDDGHVLVRSTGGAVTLNAAQTFGTGLRAGDIIVSAATTADLTALSLSSTSSGDLTVSGASASLTNGSAAGDILVSGTTGDATVVTQAIAGDDVEVATTSGDVVAGGALLRSTGVGATDSANVLARSLSGSVTVGTAQSQGTGAALGNVNILAGTTATLGSGSAGAFLNVSGASASLTTGVAGRDLQVTATTGDAAVVTSATAADDVEITTTDGDVLAGGATLTSTGLSTGVSDGHVWLTSTNGAVDFGTAITQGTGVSAGDVTVLAGDTATGVSAQATRDVSVTAPSGVSLGSATAGRDITLNAAAGDVTLGAAELTGTGAGHDLSVTGDGVVTLGAVDEPSITAANVFSRTGGSTGTASVQSLNSDTWVYLDASDAIDTLSGDNVTVLINSGPATFGAITAQDRLSVLANDGDLAVGAATANNGDLALEVYGGAMTVGTANAPGGSLELYAYDGALTITGSAHAGMAAVLQSLGLLDGTSASLISSDGALQLVGGQVDVGSLQADSLIVVAADDGNVSIQSAQAGVAISVGALDGDIFVDTAEAPDGVVIQATGDIVLNSATANGAAGVVGVVADGDATVGSVEANGVGGMVQVGASGDVLISSAKANGDDGFVLVHADADAVVELAEAKGVNGAVEVEALGDATVRAAEATSGILVYAMDAGTATLGADNGASITAAHYALTAAGSGCGCAPASDGLQVYSELGDAVVNLNAISNPITLVAAGEFGAATVTLAAGDLKIDELAAYDITIDAKTGTLETAAAYSNGGDYTITAHDFLGDVLTPTLVTGFIRDVTITDTLGGLDLGTTAIHADRTLTITALNGGSVTGAGQLDAGSATSVGDVRVSGASIALDTVLSNGDVNLNAGAGSVNVATSVGVDGNYYLTGGDLSAAALTPQGLKAGFWNLWDGAGDLDFSGMTLRYGGSIGVTVSGGDVVGDDIISDLGTVYVEAHGGHLGALHAGGGTVTAIGNVGGMAVDSAQGVARIKVTAVNGDASLGSAILTGPGFHNLDILSTNGDVVLGAATPGAITAGNIVTSTGTLTLVASTPTGRVDVNLDHTTNADLTTLSGADGVAVRVVNGSQRIVNAASSNGRVTIDGPTGALTVNQLTAQGPSQVNGGGDTQLVSAAVTGDLAVRSLTGHVRLGDATPGRLIDVDGALSLSADTDIAQQGALHADTLDVTSGTGVVLLGANQIAHLGQVNVAAGGFAFHNALDLDVAEVINATGQTVDLRSDGTINQASHAVITAGALTGSSVGGAVFDAANQVAALGDFTNAGGQLRLNSARSLTVTGAVLSTGVLSLVSHGGMTIAGAGTVRADGAGDAVVLASDGVFTNARGVDAVTAASPGGRWLIYTQAFGDPQGSTAGNTFNGLAGKSFYGAAYDFSTSSFAVGINSGNRFVYAYRPTLTVTPNSQTLTYDGTIPTPSATIAGLVNGDLAADAWSGAPAISGGTSKAVGTYALAAGPGGLASDLNYAFTYGTGALRIDPKALSGLLAADDKIYDGTVAAAGSIDLAGVVAGDAVAASGLYAFADKNAGTGKTVTASGEVLSGADAGNYILVSTASGTADIVKKDLTGALAADSKTYDGTVIATGSIGLTGVVAGDAVSASGSYAFADRNAGTGKAVTASGTALAGADAGNYSLVGVSGALADIWRRPVTVAADSLFKPFGQVEPTLTYRVTVGDLAAGDAFTGALGRETGEIPGSYGITRGTLALSANYDLTFTGAVFTIRPFPSNEAGGMPALKHLEEGPDFTLDWDPQPNLTTEGQGCLGDGCPPQGAMSGAKVVASLR